MGCGVEDLQWVWWELRGFVHWTWAGFWLAFRGVVSLVLEKLGSARLITMTGYFSATAVVVPAVTPHSERCRLMFHSAALTEALDHLLPH
jgi:hypothetical protein